VLKLAPAPPCAVAVDPAETPLLAAIDVLNEDVSLETTFASEPIPLTVTWLSLKRLLLAD
jgi:hypothetical protein